MNTSRPQDRKRIVFTNADGLANNTERSIVVLQIMRFEIENGEFSDALERLMVIADTRENALLYRESVVFSVDGYDDDARELYEIPEVRSFFSKIIDQWPHWFWFLCRDGGHISLLMSLICGLRVTRKNGLVKYEFENINHDFTKKVSDLLERGVALYEAFDISEEEATSSMESALNELGLG